MIHLHNYSTYSFLQAYGLPSQLVEACKNNKQEALALTDRAGMTGLVPFYKECKKKGIKPILGAEIFLVKTLEGEGKKEAKHTLVLLSKNAEGYKNLCNIITQCNLEGFYYTPTADYELLQKHFGNLIALSGGLEGIIPRFLNQNDINKAAAAVKVYKDIFGEDFYLEITPHESFPAKKMVELAKLTKTPYVITCDTRFPTADDFDAYCVVDCIGKKMQYKDYESRTLDEKNGVRYQMSEKELFKSFPTLKKEEIEKGIAETHKVSDKIVAALPKTSSLKFKGVDKKQLLRDVIQKGWKDRGLNKLPPEKKQEYKERLAKEWKLINEKDYVDYFLIVQDLVNWAKNNDIMVGHARGSAAGSLICWLTKITEIDPIPHGLIFERFIDINRFDPPDIDIDFEDERRDEVKEYLAKKYGKEKVASIGTIMYYKGRICFDDLGRIHNIPPYELNSLKDLIIERTGGDSRASFTIEDTLSKFPSAQETIAKYPELAMASKLEAQARQKGIHAAGVIIGNEEIKNFLPISFRNNMRVADVDKKMAEEMGFLKLDLLGLNYLSILTKARKLVKERHGVDIDYYNLPVDDVPQVYKNFQKGKLFGVFQFEGEAVNQICRQVKPSNFKELVDISALSRPGALNSGGTADYIRYKNNPETVEYIHPLIKELAEDTYGTIIYQEQVMTIMRQMGNMSWEDTSEIRRLISKTMGEEYFNTFKVKFMKGAVEENGMPEEKAEEVWKNVCTFGAFAFNKSHTVSYSYISYACMFMKTQYPLEYYACLCEEAMEWKLNKIIREFKKEGGTILLPNVNKSKLSFTIEEGAIRAGFRNVKGIGAATAEKIIKHQPYTNVEDFKSKTKVSKKIMETLKCIGALNDLEKKQQSLFGESWVETFKHVPTVDDLIKYFPYGADLDLIGNFKDKIIDKVGFDVECQTIEEILEKKPKQDVCTVAQITKRDLRNIHEVGRDSSTIKNPELADYVHLTLEDGTGFIKATINRYIYPEFKEMIWDKLNLDKTNVFLVQGKFDRQTERIFVNNIIIVNL